MIPKVIHYVWFGGGSLGEKEKYCIESWKKHLPDYDIVRWDESNFDININPYCKEAYEEKKWAFASDFARLWVLVHFGGIYMDTDVEVLKPLDSFLGHKAFSGFETPKDIPTGIMACEKEFPLFKELLSGYDERHFIKNDGTYDLTTNVVAITQYCLNHGLRLDNSYQVVNDFALYPNDYFCPKSYRTGEILLTERTCTIHHFNSSWQNEDIREVSMIKHSILRRHNKIPEPAAGIAARLLYTFRKH